ncbi:MAG TPA: hypothetical protein VFA11_05520 [Acidimicrobiales bacterium]|nr:hypothetical protein [Acidimicrobiales bacterium]
MTSASTAPRRPAPAVPTPPLRPVRALPGPRGRLGTAYAVATGLAVAGGKITLAVWLAVCVGVAAIEACRSWRGRDIRPAPLTAIVGGFAVTLASAGGWIPWLVLVVAAAALALAPVGRATVSDLGRRARAVGELARWRPGAALPAALVAPPGPPVASAWLTAGLASGLGAAAGAVVLTRQASVTAVAVLLALAWVHDASRYVVGWGAPAAWEGAAAGVAAIGAATLGLAVVQPSPLTGSAPWLAGLAAAALVPLGPSVAGALVGDRDARVPALRQLDSLLVIAPVWMLVTRVAGW